MKNIHILPTNKGQRITKTNKGTFLFCSVVAKDFIETRKDYSGFHLYITNDEEIKEGDWCINLNSPYKHKELGRIYNQIDLERYVQKTGNDCKKIILTTDQDLINDGIQAIDNEFIEWFVKNPSCESVEVKLNYLGSKCLKCGYIENHDEVDTNCYPKCSSTTYKHTTYKHLYENKIIIPKEESKTNLEKLPFPKLVEEFANYYKEVPLVEEPKKETLEEAAEKYSLEEAQKFALDKFPKPTNNEKGTVKWEDILEVLKVGVLTGHKFGTKWQAERSYSEEDMAEAFIACWKANVPDGIECKVSFNEWFKQFKNK